jgi:long-chain acyl-CoA synthetase
LLFENVYRKMRSTCRVGQELLVRVLRPPARVLRYGGLDLRLRLFGRNLAAMGGHSAPRRGRRAAIDPEIPNLQYFGIDFFLGYGLTEASPVIPAATRTTM